MNVIFCGGGTGGHLFPGISLAQYITDREEGSRIIFIVSDRNVENEIISRYPFDAERINVKPPSFHPAAFCRFICCLLKGLKQSEKILHQMPSDVLIGLGGYVSIPPIIKASKMGIPIVFLEQNSIPGKANRFLERKADRIFVQFEKSVEFFKDADKVIVAGNPVRSSILNIERKAGAPPYGLDPEGKILLILGGSLGAAPVNKLVVSILPELTKKIPDLQVIHQTGKADFEWVKRAYREVAIKSHVKGFITEMDSVYAYADAAISRAGATTIAELAVVGLPAVLIPFPHAKDDHQYYNAKELADKGAALLYRQEMIDKTEFVNTVADLLQDDAKRGEMSKHARAAAHPNACRIIYEELKKITGNRKIAER